MDQARDKILAQLLKLAEITVEHGNTANEQAIAERKARGMIERHGVTYAEVTAYAEYEQACEQARRHGHPPPPRHAQPIHRRPPGQPDPRQQGFRHPFTNPYAYPFTGATTTYGGSGNAGIFVQVVFS